VGNNLNCTNCHFDSGRELHTISLVGTAAVYPKFRKRQDYAVDLVTRTQDCFERSMNGTSPEPDSKEMTAILTYYQWISKGLPIYTEIPWLGLKHLKSDHKPAAEIGRTVFEKSCAECHGADGQGTKIAPPLWGEGSFNDGAGMNKFDNFAAFTKHFMPKGAPNLTIPEAMDAASFVLANPRPHFQSRQ
jgi:thiosulfate dehydrogenase